MSLFVGARGSSAHEDAREKAEQIANHTVRADNRINSIAKSFADLALACGATAPVRDPYQR